jgi:hypothetical protein
MPNRSEGPSALPAESRNFKQPLLYALIASVILGALLGIIVVLRGEWGWFEVRVILTTVTVAIASLCGLACDLSRTPASANLLPKAGLGLTLVAATMVLVGIWTEMDSEPFWKSTASACILSVATVHVCLLSIARLAKKFRWVRAIATQTTYGLAVLLIVMIFWELDDDALYRFVIAVAIVDAALTLIVPILHRISRMDRNETPVQTLLEQQNLAAVEEEIARLKERIARLEAVKARLQSP